MTLQESPHFPRGVEWLVRALVNFGSGGKLKVITGGELKLEAGATMTVDAGATVTGLTGQTTFASGEEAAAGVVTDKVIAPDTLASAVPSLVPAASATVQGKVELATSAETITGTDADRAVTPAGLAALTTSVTRSGLVELATDAEALAGADTARAVTPHGLAGAILKIDIIAFVGKNGAGACTATGLKASDVILSVTGVAAADAGDKASLFEAVVTVNDQIQQSSATDLSTKTFMALVFRQS
jgi:hypothetical protein